MAIRRGKVMMENIAQFLYSAMPALALAACAIGACCENLKDK
jgi:hypothetical protein